MREVRKDQGGMGRKREAGEGGGGARVGKDDERERGEDSRGLHKHTP